MAVQLRISDRRAYVLASDPDAVPASEERIAGAWIDAAGQPDGATRFVVRPLNAVELSAWSAASQGDAQAAAMDAVWLGYCPAEDQPARWQDCDASIAMCIVGLVLAVTMGGADPLGGASA